MRTAVIGYGLGGRAFHAAFIAAEPRLQLVAIVTSDATRAAEAAATHPGTAVVSRVEELWALQPELVCIASPNRMHVPLALAAIERGCHVVIDKPIATTSREARDVGAIAQRAGVSAVPLLNRRWDAAVLTAQRVLAAGEIGRAVRLQLHFDRYRPAVVPRWRESPDPADGGGSLFDLGPHLIDQARLLMGEVDSVDASMCAARPGALVADDIVVMLRHVSAGTSVLSISMLGGDPGPRVQVIGTAGTYSYRGLDAQDVQLTRGDPVSLSTWGVESAEESAGSGWIHREPEHVRVPSERADARIFWRGLAAHLIDGGPPPVTWSDGVRTVEVLEAAIRSHASGEVVRL
jgi:predicted dehydrogenase